MSSLGRNRTNGERPKTRKTPNGVKFWPQCSRTLHRMSLDPAYANTLVDRRVNRARRALFLARYVRIALIITVILTLRADADLRSALLRAGSDAFVKMADLRSDPRVRRSLAGPLTRSENGLPDTRVKVNRPPNSAENLQIDAQAIARQVTTTLATRDPN